MRAAVTGEKPVQEARVAGFQFRQALPPSALPSAPRRFVTPAARAFVLRGSRGAGLPPVSGLTGAGGKMASEGSLRHEPSPLCLMTRFKGKWAVCERGFLRVAV